MRDVRRSCVWSREIRKEKDLLAFFLLALFGSSRKKIKHNVKGKMSEVNEGLRSFIVD
jgi:hypothetical protein